MLTQDRDPIPYSKGKLGSPFFLASLLWIGVYDRTYSSEDAHALCLLGSRSERLDIGTLESTDACIPGFVYGSSRHVYGQRGRRRVQRLCADRTGSCMPSRTIKDLGKGRFAPQLESQLATARLQTLKNQLQPHFLFNTMHSISALMLTDVQAADRMICQLSDLSRISLEAAGTQITTLKRELEFVNCYLEIEKVRFEERLKVVYEIAPETLDAEIPHLLLQPIVDNAVKHGISKLPEGGQITIKSARRDGKLEIEITNARPTAQWLQSNGADGIGLRVTRERLESLYGIHQAFELLDSIDGVKMARVRIPYALQSNERD